MLDARDLAGGLDRDTRVLVAAPGPKWEGAAEDLVATAPRRLHSPRPQKRPGNDLQRPAPAQAPPYGRCSAPVRPM